MFVYINSWAETTAETIAKQRAMVDSDIRHESWPYSGFTPIWENVFLPEIQNNIILGVLLTPDYTFYFYYNKYWNI